MVVEVKAMYSCRVWWYEPTEDQSELVMVTQVFDSEQERDDFLTQRVNEGKIFDIAGMAESFWTEPGPMSDAEWEACLSETYDEAGSQPHTHDNGGAGAQTQGPGESLDSGAGERGA